MGIVGVKLNGKWVGTDAYPNGERIFKDLDIRDSKNVVELHYDGSESFETAIVLIGFLNVRNTKDNTLRVPYLPYLRMDRQVEGFPPMKEGMLGVLDALASQHGWHVETIDPHSNVPLWIYTSFIEPYVSAAINTEQPNFLVLPDAGSEQRYGFIAEKYGNMLNGISLPIVYGDKERDPHTGKITRIGVVEPDFDLRGKNTLFVDDIISYGGTVLGIAKALKEDYGVNRVAVYATHTELSILKGNIPESPFVDAVYTTPSIITESPHSKIVVL